MNTQNSVRKIGYCSHIAQNRNFILVYKNTKQVQPSLGLVALACNSSEGIKVVELCLGPAGWVCLCSIWLARSKLIVGSCGLSEGLGHLDPRVGGNALGWFHRAAITPRFS